MSQSDVTLVMRKAIHKVAIRLDYTPWLARLIKVRQLLDSGKTHAQFTALIG